MLIPAGEPSGGVMATSERNLAILSAEKFCLEAQRRKDECQDKRMGDNYQRKRGTETSTLTKEEGVIMGAAAMRGHQRRGGQARWDTAFNIAPFASLKADNKCVSKVKLQHALSSCLWAGFAGELTLFVSSTWAARHPSSGIQCSLATTMPNREIHPGTSVLK